MTDPVVEMRLFSDAVELGEVDRAVFVQTIEDPLLRQRVLDLIRAHDDIAAEAVSPIISSMAGLGEPLPHGLLEGYRILRVLGRGGMGVVFEAEHLATQRRVAIKTVASAFASPEELSRLEREARCLARFSHPGVAQIYEVARSESCGGIPCIVMELIDGIPINRFVAEAKLTVNEKVALLAELADTVSHVHTRGLVHRDLKPANVLVDRSGRAKVLDFGIARLGSGASDQGSLLTRTGQILGTLAYMSPEQCHGGTEAVDGRSDIYSLGAIGFELFSGRTPFDFAGESLPTAIRRIAEEEPSSMGAACPTIPRDVATVIDRSLRKSASERYATAGDLAADLRRILDHQPILARRRTRTYLVAKFLRRHRLAVLTIVALVTSLATGLVWSLSERSRAQSAEATERAAKEEAEDARSAAVAAEQRASAAAASERQRAESMSRLSQLLANIVARATPQEHGGRPITAEQMVDGLEEDLAAGRVSDVYVRGRAHLLLCDARKKGGRLADAQHHLERARADLENHILTGIEDRADLAVAAAVCAQDSDSKIGAINILRELSAVKFSDAGTERRVCAALANALASVPLSLVEAERLARRACAVSLESHGERSITHGGDLHTLAFVLGQAGRWSEAVPVYERVVAVRRQVEDDSLGVATALQNLGLALRSCSRMPEAIAAATEAVEIKRQILGVGPHQDLAYGLDTLAMVLRDGGRPQESLALFEEAAIQFTQIFGEDHEDLAICLTEWAMALRYISDPKAAREKAAEAVRIHGAWSDRPTAAHAAAWEQLGLSAIECEDANAALEAGRRAVDLREAVHGKEHPLVAEALVVVATSLLVLSRPEEAGAAGQRVMQLRRDAYGEADPRTFEDAALVYAPLVQLGRIAEARSVAQSAYDLLLRTLGPEHAHTKVAQLGLTHVLRWESEKSTSRPPDAPPSASPGN